MPNRSDRKLDDGIQANGACLASRTLLVVAHDFPPIRSPQSIRAAALARELARAGATVEVLTRTMAPGTPEPPGHEQLTIHRASPGLFEAAVDRIASRRRGRSADPSHGPTKPSVHPSVLNWKGQAIRGLRRLRARLLFPDDRVAWVPAARRLLVERLAGAHFDAALVMHEPAAALLLTKTLDDARLPWVADLADPVLARYTPMHWRHRAFQLEASIVARARAVIVTNAETGVLLRARHASLQGEVRVIPQGFDPVPMPPAKNDGALRLVYTGRFYAFRDPTPLLEAVGTQEGIELVIAGPEMPDAVIRAAEAWPASIQIVGELDHEAARRLQASADVLVSVGNSGTTQTPGKVYEYFGVARPVLHIASDPEDPIPRLLLAAGRGLGCKAEPASIKDELQRLLIAKRSGQISALFDLSDAAVEQFSWPALGRRLAGVFSEVLAP